LLEKIDINRLNLANILEELKDHISKGIEESSGHKDSLELQYLLLAIDNLDQAIRFVNISQSTHIADLNSNDKFGES
jgi:hypothetical protein